MVRSGLVWFGLIWCEGEGLPQVWRSCQAGLRLRALWLRLLWRLCLHQKGENIMSNKPIVEDLNLFSIFYQVGNRHKVVCKPCDDGWLRTPPLFISHNSFVIIQCHHIIRLLLQVTLCTCDPGKTKSALLKCNQPTQPRLYTFNVHLQKGFPYPAPQSIVCNNCDLFPMWSNQFHKRCKRRIKFYIFEDH